MLKRVAYVLLGTVLLWVFVLFLISRWHFRKDIDFQNYWVADTYFSFDIFQTYFYETILPTQEMAFKNLVGLNTSECLDTLSVLTLQLGQNERKKLEAQMTLRLSDKKAIRIGTNHWSYVPGRIKIDAQNKAVQIRIRGDLEPNFDRGLEKASFRFNVEDSLVLLDGSRWSLLMPYQENNLYGMIYYNVFRSEGFISPINQFVRLNLNEKELGIYLLQQAFSKELLEKNGRENGLIYRAKNDCADQMYAMKCTFPVFDSYKNNYDETDETYIGLKHDADSLLQLFVDDKAIIDDVFDYDQLAKFIVLSEIFLSHHTMACHNMRFYYNSTKKRFEPIAWDPASFLTSPFKGDNERFMENYNSKWNLPLYRLMLGSDKFNRKYKKYMQYYLEDDLMLKKINKAYLSLKDFEPFLDYHHTHIYNLNRVKRNIIRLQETL